VELQRRLERQVALFQFLHDRLELGDRSLEVLDGGIPLLSYAPGAVVSRSVTAQSSSPCSSLTCTRSPRSTAAASRMMAVRSSFQQTAYPRARTASGLRLSSRAAAPRKRASATCTCRSADDRRRPSTETSCA